MAKAVREEYRQRKGSTVWHFMKACRFFSSFYARDEGAMAANMKAQKSRPKSGTLCDNCQNLERKAAKK